MGWARGCDPPRPESIWWEADNEPVNVLCPSVRDTQYGRGAKEKEEVLLSLPSFLFPLSRSIIQMNLDFGSIINGTKFTQKPDLFMCLITLQLSYLSAH